MIELKKATIARPWLQGEENHKCFAPGLARQREWERSVGGGADGRLQLPWLMRGVHGTEPVRLIAILRDPTERVHSGFWFWPQYRRKYGATAQGFLVGSPLVYGVGYSGRCSPCQCLGN